MLRHRATRALVERKDVVIVASVSCLYGVGMPEKYVKHSMRIEPGAHVGSPSEFRNKLEDILYEEAASLEDMQPGEYHMHTGEDGNADVRIHPPYEKDAVAVRLVGGTTVACCSLEDLEHGEDGMSMEGEGFTLYPARHYVSSEEQRERACERIEEELAQQTAHLHAQNDFIAAERLEEIVSQDLELIRTVGHCKGIENYSRHIDGRDPNQAPYTLVDFFNYTHATDAEGKGWLLCVDESHITLPQINAMYHGDRARKKKLVKHGFRLPSALDNRPLKFDEFWDLCHQTVFLSATPNHVERGWCDEAANALEGAGEGRGADMVEMVIRPTHCLDPLIEVRPKGEQLESCFREIEAQVARGEKTFILTISKRDAEEMTLWLQAKGVRCDYIHSGLNATDRARVLQRLQHGAIDAIVGVNLLREGLDVPEVSLVVVLAADCEGFLRSKTSLIQAIGRAARHKNGRALFFADRVTGAMRECMEETERRRGIQMAYNNAHGLTPYSCTNTETKSIFEVLDKDIQEEQERLATARKAMASGEAGNDGASQRSRLGDAAVSTSGGELDDSQWNSIDDERFEILKDTVAAFPTTPGVYTWKGEGGEVLYVGKAKSLRNRAKSYLASTKDQSFRTKRMAAMIARARSVDYHATPTEGEALVMEAQLIKHLQPLYNILLKDGSRFPYLKITDAEVPELKIAYERSKGTYFGPYANTASIKSVMQALETHLGLGVARVEARYGAGQEAYRDLMRRAEAILRGEHVVSGVDVPHALLGHGGVRCDVAVVQSTGGKEVAEGDGGECLVHVVSGAGMGASKFAYRLRATSVDSASMGAILQRALEHHYSSVEGGVPSRVIVQHALPDASWIEAIIQDQRNGQEEEEVVVVGPPSPSEQILVDDAAQEVRVEAREERIRAHLSEVGVTELGDLLGLDAKPDRIECFDVSHLQGEAVFASCVTFVDGKPQPRAHKRLFLSGHGNDDAGGIERAVFERYADASGKGLPDLVVVDGGKGQLTAARRGLERAGVSLPVCAIAKRHEHVFVPGRSDPLDADASSPGVLLLRAIRDESHRFALKAHRRARGDGMGVRDIEPVQAQEERIAD